MIGILLVASVLMAGCTEDDGVNEVTVTGSSTNLPIAQMCAEEFNSEHDNIRVSVSGGGSGYGISAIIEGTADIGMSSRDIRQSERDQIPDLVEYTIGIDGLAIIVSKPVYNAGITGLTTQQVIDIYSGQTNNWNEIGGPDEDIYVVERAETSGTYGSFMDMMGLEETAAHSTQLENSDVRRTVTTSDYAIGYVGMAYTGGDAPAVSLDGVEPTVANVQAGHYSLQRNLYFYLNGEPTGAVKEYVDFVMSSRGQEIVAEVGFIPAH